MTESEWNAASSSVPMMMHLQGKTSNRKVRLFCCACAQWLAPSQLERECRVIIRVAEDFADGLVSDDTFGTACEHAQQLLERMVVEQDFETAAYLRDFRSAVAYERSAVQIARSVAGHSVSGVRCIFGNPFHPVVLDRAWLAWNNGTVPKLAQAIHEERAFERLPILADALEEASCTDKTILSHCRGPAPHVRGCWVLDLLLNKE